MRRVLIDRESRTKLVNFRVSPAEAAILVDRAEAFGARSVSDFVRILTLNRLVGRSKVDALSESGDPEIGPEGFGDQRLSEHVAAILGLLEEALKTARREIGGRAELGPKERVES